MSITKTNDFSVLIGNINFYHKSIEQIAKENEKVIITTDLNGRPTALQDLLLCIGALATDIVPSLIKEIIQLRAENERLRDGGKF